MADVYELPGVASGDAESSGLQIDARLDGTTKVLAVAGDLDAASTPALIQCAHAAIASTRGDLVIDLSRIGFMDSSGTDALLNIHLTQ